MYNMNYDMGELMVQKDEVKAGGGAGKRSRKKEETIYSSP